MVFTTGQTYLFAKTRQRTQEESPTGDTNSPGTLCFGTTPVPKALHPGMAAALRLESIGEVWLLLRQRRTWAVAYLPSQPTASIAAVGIPPRTSRNIARSGNKASLPASWRDIKRWANTTFTAALKFKQKCAGMCTNR